MSQPAIVAGFVVCCLVITTIVLATTLTLGIKTHNDSKCASDAMFVDLPPSFSMEQQWVSSTGTLKVANNLGSFSKDWTIGTRYIYRNGEGKVVAQAERGWLSRTFTITRCSDDNKKESERKNDYYEIYQEFFSIGKIEWDLSKNGVLIAEPSKSTFFTCKPDIIMQNTKGDVIATIDRSCGESFITDTWYIKNLQENPVRATSVPINTSTTNSTNALNATATITMAASAPKNPEYIENYVLGFMAYLTSMGEQDDKSSRKKT